MYSCSCRPAEYLPFVINHTTGGIIRHHTAPKGVDCCEVIFADFAPTRIRHICSVNSVTGPFNVGGYFFKDAFRSCARLVSVSTKGFNAGLVILASTASASSGCLLSV